MPERVRPSAAEVDREMARISAVVDDFANAIKARLRYKVMEGYTGWDDGYPASALRDELLQDAADIRRYRTDQTELRLQRKLTDIGARSMFLWFRSRLVAAHKGGG